YGASFEKWFKSDSRRGYGSYGNGSAMRVSPIGLAYDRLETVLREARLSAIVTHNHREGIKGAQAVASAVFLAKNGESKAAVRKYIEQRFRYDLHQRFDDIRPGYQFDSSCQGSVPQALIAFLESDDFEDAIRKAISLGGDSDTIACIAGGIAHAYYKLIPAPIASRAKLLLDGSLKPVFNEFNARFGETGRSP
ncbi:MAG TPA: ADP-ribosylglycohydrolase family protein, partial [Aggregatilineaceae bacterium]|nr:ADP-ribosylglycohydrolase family protein [Aggregatilineaceae bacterium]